MGNKLLQMDFKIHHWPSLVGGWYILTYTISYIIGVSAGTVRPILPSISEFGSRQPSNAIFAQMLNIGALLSAVFAYIRYKQIDLVIKSKITKLHKRWNEMALYMGFLSSFGLIFVANFSVDQKAYHFSLICHLIGALMAFGFGFIYLLIQIKITFDLQPYYDRYPEVAVIKFVQYLRLLIVICFAISGAIIAAYLPAFVIVHDADLQFVTPGSPAYYTDHLVSAIAELAMAILIIAFSITMTNELKFMSFKEICFENFIDDKEK